MAKTPEGRVKEQIKKILNDAKAYYFMPVNNGMGRNGIPDFIVCWRGRFMGIEAKAGRGKTTALQDRELANIMQAGGVALVINENTIAGLESSFANNVWIPNNTLWIPNKTHLCEEHCLLTSQSKEHIR